MAQTVQDLTKNPLLQRERLSLQKSATKPPRMSPVTMVIVGLILVLLLASLGKTFFAPKAAPVETVQVVGAGQDIMPGSRINYSSLHYITVPRSYFHEDMFAKNNLVVGRIARAYVAKGEPLLAASLMPKGQTLSQQVETHERAVSLKLDDEALVDHGIVCGDKVDVLFTTSKDGKKYTRTICQNLPVIYSLPKEALKSKSLQGNDAARITLAVTPEQAEILAQAEETGRIKLALRNRLSVTAPHSYGVSEEDLLPAKALTASAAAPAPVQTATAPSTANFESIAPPPPPFIMPPTFNEVASRPEVKKAAQWVVEVFTGNRRETHEFPRQEPTESK
ncbi:MAG TPA: Flp pilus assembly protein CpaB [Candidatus Obscuribacter sp.]|nr:Flp pilus assembly protein CpaB [Candidatus Obscuribacter sp.]MBK9281639.1 Flp pilus assembly protein CpaB [Candidatus Obscuribacter sp.]MBL8082571.1 Flp pilus assembly protein CpaB [Candidatus Obscuribacter sp.]HMY55047.1 Flp pilus assembly protein CpaB [Candidatus Obscuribacter sp.]HND07332.1 Flp pilus assembly protein CpaB [Candidatus Obscuribacter sp.]